MNLFVVDRDPVLAARALADRHVVKMSLETAQIACTVAHRVGVSVPYRPTHASHPCTRWAASTRGNFRWVLDHGNALLAEYRCRYGRDHASGPALSAASAALSRLPAGVLTPFAQVVPEPLRRADAVAAYRAYYAEKMAAWGDRARWSSPGMRPQWLPGSSEQ